MVNDIYFNNNHKKKPTLQVFIIITGTALCNGDSGGGLVFPSKDLSSWTLQGVVSLSPRKQSTFFCDPTKYTVFTKVGFYVKWIKYVLNTIHDIHNNKNTPTTYEPIL